MSRDPARPIIVLALANDLGYGELGCYGGGALRGAPTPRIDKLATQGLSLHNLNVESDCVPTRSAVMSGRHPIRTGCRQSVPAGFPQGLTEWERTLAECLETDDYDTAHHGKWHLGDIPGRYPSDRGFDECFGIPRTTDETQFTSAIGYTPEIAEFPYIMKGVAGGGIRECVHLRFGKAKAHRRDAHRTIKRLAHEKGGRGKGILSLSSPGQSSLPYSTP